MGILQDWTKQGHLTPDAAASLSVFAGEIHRWNPSINLTGLKSQKQIEDLLVGESLLAIPHLQLAGRSVLDFGSGAGIPGFVWAIAEPACGLISVEIRQKRIAFQKQMLRQLELTNVEVVQGLFPDAVAGRKFDVIATRAVRFSVRLWDEAEKLLRLGGCLVRYGTPDSPAPPGWKIVPVSRRSVLLLKHL